MVRASPKRDQNLRIMVSRKEKKMIRSLAKARGLTISDYLRQLIRDKHEEWLEEEATS